MAPTKGKQATKGQKQILEENKETLVYYSIMAICSEILYVFVMTFGFWEDYTALYWFLTAMTIVAFGGSIQFMVYMARPSFSEKGQLLDGGIDLNMDASISEHLKDLIILTAGVQTLSILSNYFWLLWLLAPGRAFYLLWVNILAPWIFQPAPEVDEKKQKKMERKAKRH